MTNNPQEIELKVKQVLANQSNIKVEHIELGSLLTNDLGIDSLGAVEVAFAIKDNFNIDIPDEDLSSFRTVDDIVKFIISNPPQAKE